MALKDEIASKLFSFQRHCSASVGPPLTFPVLLILGPYGSLMASFLQAATEHFEAMTFGPPQLSQSNKSATPCCNPPQCTCNYPGPTL